MSQASLRQVNQLLSLIVDAGWTREELQRRILERWGLLRQIAEAVDELGEEQVRAMHPLFYNKMATFQSLLAACRQDWVNSDFNEENYHLEPTAPDEEEWEVYEYHFKDVVSGEQAFVELEKLGYRLCGVRRAMEFIAAHPDLQMDHPVLVTARWQDLYGYWYAPIAYWHVDKRNLRLDCLGSDFSPYCGWLVLRKHQ